MAVLSPKGDVIIVSPIITFVLITVTLALSAFSFSFSFICSLLFLKLSLLRNLTERKKTRTEIAIDVSETRTGEEGTLTVAEK